MTQSENQQETAPEAAPMSGRGDLFSILLSRGEITEDDAEQARRRRRRNRLSPQQAVLDLGTVSEEAVYRAVATGASEWMEGHG